MNVNNVTHFFSKSIHLF